MKKNSFALFLILSLISCATVSAQSMLQNNYSYSMEIPSVVAMESSEAHLYVLSEAEGMAVFRTRTDSLQWLYTAAGMQQRGSSLHADIRFAYLFGNSKRLTVLEPTSVMGAYSSTNLPSQPLDVQRLDESLFVILGSGNFGKLNLNTPESLDSRIQQIEPDVLAEKSFIDIEAASDRLFLLTDNSELITFNKNGNGITRPKSTSLGKNISRLFFVNNALMGTNNEGEIYEVSANNDLSKLGSIGESVIEIKAWNNWLIIKGSSNRLWASYQLREPTLWKKNRDAGNHLAVSKGQLWISEYNRISRVTEAQQQPDSQGNTSAEPPSTLKIKPIDDLTIPYPQSLIIPLKLEGNFPIADVQFNLQSNVQGAVVRGQSLYWKPKSGDVGQHQFKVIASTGSGQSSSTRFTVDVRSFNAPPRFTPMRTISIPVGQPFNLPIQATDPDGINKNLIRYLGINLPNGASIDEQTGEFTWTPSKRSIGENTFRVIATDQYGAAASVNVSIRVIDTGSDN